MKSMPCIWSLQLLGQMFYQILYFMKQGIIQMEFKSSQKHQKNNIYKTLPQFPLYWFLFQKKLSQNPLSNI